MWNGNEKKILFERNSNEKFYLKLIRLNLLSLSFHFVENNVQIPEHIHSTGKKGNQHSFASRFFLFFSLVVSNEPAI